MPRERGYLAEQEFIRRLNNEGIPYNYIDDWCDFTIYNTPIDVKSCLLSHKFSNKHRKNQNYKIGRFIITEKQREKKCYLALFVRHNKEHLFLGITKINKKTSKYISIHKTRTLELIDLKTWIKKIKKQ